jgi:hypothetical protein
MKEVLLAEWTGLLDRIKTRFGDADLNTTKSGRS